MAAAGEEFPPKCDDESDERGSLELFFRLRLLARVAAITWHGADRTRLGAPWPLSSSPVGHERGWHGISVSHANQRHGEDDAEVPGESENRRRQAHDRLLAHELFHKLGICAESGKLREVYPCLRGRELGLCG